MPPYIELENMPSAAVMPAARPRARPEHGNTADNVRSWTAFLGEFVGAGQIRIGTSQPAVTLEHQGNWPGIRIEDSLGIAPGRRFTLRMVLDRWSHIDRSGTDATDRDQRPDISILDREGAPLLDLGFGEDHRGLASDVLTRYAVLCRSPSWFEPEPKHTEDAGKLSSNPVRGTAAELRNAVDVADLAEATGQLFLSPARLRERGCVKAADAALVPCFLEALADQALPVRIVTGTAGVAHSLDCAFVCHRREGVWQTLRSDSARFRIDTSKIDSAWVLKVSEATHEHSSLRLYDARGRSLATIASVPGFVVGENPIWRTLVNALQD
jgi:putative heme degradation protein